MTPFMGIFSNCASLNFFENLCSEYMIFIYSFIFGNFHGLPAKVQKNAPPPPPHPPTHTHTQKGKAAWADIAHAKF